MKPWTTEGRKTLRSLVQAVILISFIVLLWFLAGPGDTHWLIAVIAISVVGNQIENGVRSFKIGKDGIEADGTGGNP